MPVLNRCQLCDRRIRADAKHGYCRRDADCRYEYRRAVYLAGNEALTRTPRNALGRRRKATPKNPQAHPNPLKTSLRTGAKQETP